jgi:hypothetical protein
MITPFKTTNDLTVTSNISASNLIYDGKGNSSQWNSTYTTVNSNSATIWNYQGTDVKSLTGNWQNSTNWVNSNSANANFSSVTIPDNTFSKIQFSTITQTVTTGAVTPTVTQFTTTGSVQSFVIPPSVTSITVECWGAGGAGGSAQRTSGNGFVYGGGGAGGDYSYAVLTVTPGTTYYINVGIGGVASPTAPFTTNHTVSGTDSWFSTTTSSSNSLVLAKGGGGGGDVGGTGGSTGNAGTVTSSGNIGTTIYLGGAGSVPSNSYAGAGGGGAGSSGAGGASVAGTGVGGTGTALYGGNGANSANSANGVSTGSNGFNYGGGGSGATAQASARIGGNGSQGLVQITASGGAVIFNSSIPPNSLCLSLAVKVSSVGSGTATSYTVYDDKSKYIGTNPYSNNASAIIPSGTGYAYTFNTTPSFYFVPINGTFNNGIFLITAYYINTTVF